ncbi:MAG: hypothetical protein HC903_26715 [Methylacidiphilales bacterium]|nr:hypothetical protein [Candidatus Methylacidiphilales bacterium]NJR15539.1 hypothetical protein [Calothrix sp. CSU_2_0]
MKLKLLALSAFSISAISTFIPGFTSSAKAVCVLTDVSVQLAIHGKNSVANQKNNVNQQASDNCYGNTATSTGVQVHTGHGSVNQNRNSSQYVSGGNNPTGVPMPAIKIHVNPQIDVPALPNY